MADEKKNPVSEVIEKSASAANTIQGAVKTGKAIAGIAKGSAVGGPYGAALAALWTNKKTILKVVLSMLFVLMLPILFILMLPALIFGGLADAFTADNPEIPILNDNSAIVQNIEETGSILNTIMLESLDDLYAEIDNDFLSSSGDVKEIVNPYEGSNIIDANLIICQYSAAHDKDFTQISLSDLESTVRSNRNALFSYTKTTEVVERLDIDPDTGAEITIKEIVMTYTIIYNGDTHFADAVFFLTDEQKALAAEYNANLHTFLNDNYIATGNATHALLVELAEANPYSGPSESFASPFDADWRSLVTSEFGIRVDPITHEINSGHSGIDLGAGLGTEIKAVMSGKVILVRHATTGYGYHVAINHGNGLITLYAHCSRILVAEGDIVSQGDVIALVGSTGRSTGNHLHLEVISDGVPQDPRRYLP